MRAGIAFGSNLGDRLAMLKGARVRVVGLAGVKEPILTSSVYETEPVDCTPGSGVFLNAVIEVGYSGGCENLLGELRRIEQELGRLVSRERNAPRTLDLDLLYLDDEVISRPHLRLPHPRMHERRFVLEPLAEIRSDLILPRQSENVNALLRSLPETTPLRRVASEW